MFVRWLLLQQCWILLLQWQQWWLQLWYFQDLQLQWKCRRLVTLFQYIYTFCSFCCSCYDPNTYMEGVTNWGGDYTIAGGTCWGDSSGDNGGGSGTLLIVVGVCLAVLFLVLILAAIIRRRRYYASLESSGAYTPVAAYNTYQAAPYNTYQPQTQVPGNFCLVRDFRFLLFLGYANYGNAPQYNANYYPTPAAPYEYTSSSTERR